MNPSHFIIQLDWSPDRHNLKPFVSYLPQEIDAYWLQRRIGRAYGDAIDAPRAQQLAEEVLSTLASATDSRAVENELVLALGFEQFELIKELLRNRPKIVWCTRLSRTQV